MTRFALIALAGCQATTPPRARVTVPVPAPVDASPGMPSVGAPCTADIVESIAGPTIAAGPTSIVVCRIAEPPNDRRANLVLHPRRGADVTFDLGAWTDDPAHARTWKFFDVLHAATSGDAVFVLRSDAADSAWDVAMQLLGGYLDPTSGWMMVGLVERANEAGVLVEGPGRARVEYCDYDREGTMGCFASTFEVTFDGATLERQ